MSPARRRAIAQKGAQKLHATGRAHQFTSDTGRAAATLRHHPEVEDTEQVGE